MANPFDQIQPPVKELHHQAAFPAKAYNDANSPESDDWVDRSREDDDFDDGTDCHIRLEWSRSPDEVRDASGREILGEVTAVVDPDEATFTAGDEDTLATEVVDERPGHGERYRLLRRIDEGTGVWRFDSERVL